MTATTIPLSTSISPAEHSTSSPKVWRAGVASGFAAAVATAAVAAAAKALDVPVEAAPGEAIPIVGFAQLTLFFTAVGVLLARVIARRAAHPRSMFVATTVVLTVLSCVPDVMLSTDVASKVTLVTTHLVAAAIVIPSLASRLADQDIR